MDDYDMLSGASGLADVNTARIEAGLDPVDSYGKPAGFLPSVNAAYQTAENYYKAVQDANATNIRLNEINNAAMLQLAEATNVARLAESQRDRDFQAYMSNTAHQREMLDLQKAGLNPILAANGGAAVTAGSMALLDTPNRNAGRVDPEVLDYSQVASILSGYGQSLINAISRIFSITSNTSNITSNSTNTSNITSQSVNHNFNYRGR